MAEYTDYEHFTDYRIFDADQHLSEGPDAFTRHIESKYRGQTMAIAEKDGRRYLTVEGRSSVLGGTPGKVVRPGSLKEMLKALKVGSPEHADYQYMDEDPAMSDPKLRLEMLDKQMVEACILYSQSAGLVAEHHILDNDLYYASSWAYLRYLEEEWGFSTANRMFVAPIFSLRDPVRTVEQLDYFYERGGKVVSMVPGPAYGRSPGDPFFDPIWDRINSENGVVAYHINEAMPSYKKDRSEAWGEEPYPTFFEQSAWQWYWAYGDVPAQETFSSLIYGNLFHRFPNLTIISAEHGCEWVPLFVRKLDKMRGMGRNGRWIGGQLPERPSTIFTRHFKVIPFWEDDVTDVVERVGHEILLGGSDFPHAEGLAAPTRLIEHLEMLSPEQQKFVMRDNGMALLG